MDRMTTLLTLLATAALFSAMARSRVNQAQVIAKKAKKQPLV